MYANESENDMVECPYNKYHRMIRRRLQPHLIKCRLSYPDVELCKCPFNATHLVPEPEFTVHVTNCPDKALITQYKYNAMPIKIDEEDRRKQPEVECDDNWDDTEAEDYDPKKYASQANVIRSHIGDLPSARKEFRKSERKRLGDEDSSEEEEKEKEGDKKGVYKDVDCKKEDEERENLWYEDLGKASTSRNSGQHRENYEESLEKFAKDRGLKGERKRQIKTEKSDEEDPKKKREDQYHLDEDPYYKGNSIMWNERRYGGERDHFRGGRDNFRGGRGDLKGGRDDFRGGRGDFRGGRDDFRGGRGAARRRYY